jgi:cellulose biosynthesis protein BcsQ
MTFEFDSDRVTFDVTDGLDEDRVFDMLDRLEKALGVGISRNMHVSEAPGYGDPVTRYEFDFVETLEYSPQVEDIYERFLQEWRTHK